jgi:hypothetical protein
MRPAEHNGSKAHRSSKRLIPPILLEDEYCYRIFQLGSYGIIAFLNSPRNIQGAHGKRVLSIDMRSSTIFFFRALATSIDDKRSTGFIFRLLDQFNTFFICGVEQPVACASIGSGYIVQPSVDVAEAERAKAGCTCQPSVLRRLLRAKEVQMSRM